MKLREDQEALDHELNRLPVTRSMKLAVTAAAQATGVPVATLQRQALTAWLKQLKQLKQGS